MLVRRRTWFYRLAGEQFAHAITFKLPLTSAKAKAAARTLSPLPWPPRRQLPGILWMCGSGSTRREACQLYCVLDRTGFSFSRAIAMNLHTFMCDETIKRPSIGCLPFGWRNG